jgi:hypothetical protein
MRNLFLGILWTAMTWAGCWGGCSRIPGECTHSLQDWCSIAHTCIGISAYKDTMNEQRLPSHLISTSCRRHIDMWASCWVAYVHDEQMSRVWIGCALIDECDVAFFGPVNDNEGNQCEDNAKNHKAQYLNGWLLNIDAPKAREIIFDFSKFGSEFYFFHFNI